MSVRSNSTKCKTQNVTAISQSECVINKSSEGDSVIHEGFEISTMSDVEYLN